MPVLKNISNIGGREVIIQIEVDDLPTVSKGNATAIDADDGFLGGSSLANATYERARDLFEEGVVLIQNCAEGLVEKIEAISRKTRPDEVEVKLGIKMDGKAGAVLVTVGGEAQLEVTLKWNLANRGQTSSGGSQ
ncbi:MAG: hypothetical protein HW380_958 [Magnetococcales bacterium]|nr:hypothetical protein [Magnetococcales bacterium]